VNARVLGQTVKLIVRLARDKSLDWRVRLPLWLVVPYLACPIDLIPDFIPVIGHADDVLIVAWALRTVVKRAGHDALVRNWPGDSDGLSALMHTVRLFPVTV
jgi:uncharacterized membrane protein YkvA (DUF1232 family)